MESYPGTPVSAKSPFAMPGPNDVYQPRAAVAGFRKVKQMELLTLQHRTSPADLSAMRDISKLATRAALLDRGQETIRAVEIGTWIGESLVTIAQGIDEAVTESGQPDIEVELMAVDTFKGSPSDQTKDLCDQYGGSLCQLWHHNTCQVHTLATPFKLALMITDSATASKLLNHEELFDLINIDAEHTYEACRQDIQAWWPLLAEGGYMMGHDYSDLFPGVVVAVDQCALEITKAAPMLIQGTCVWMIQKPDKD